MSDFKQKVYVDISDMWEAGYCGLDYTEHIYNSCNNDDKRPQNAYYNGCPRCVAIACAIADKVVLECDVVLIKE